LVAKWHAIEVPSLIADRRVAPSDDGSDAIARAEHHIEVQTARTARL
jgi:hypothetical protein